RRPRRLLEAAEGATAQAGQARVSLRFLADENFQRVIVRGVLRELPDLDILRAQDIDLGGIDDPGILTWAARQGRILLTHDAKTIPRFAYDRIERGELMTGVL